jgi:hypothetical protein
MISRFFRNVSKYSANAAESVVTRPEPSWGEREREREERERERAFHYSIETAR